MAIYSIKQSRKVSWKVAIPTCRAGGSRTLRAALTREASLATPFACRVPLATSFLPPSRWSAPPLSRLRPLLAASQVPAPRAATTCPSSSRCLPSPPSPPPPSPWPSTAPPPRRPGTARSTPLALLDLLPSLLRILPAPLPSPYPPLVDSLSRHSRRSPPQGASLPWGPYTGVAEEMMAICRRNIHGRPRSLGALQVLPCGHRDLQKDLPFVDDSGEVLVDSYCENCSILTRLQFQQGCYTSLHRS